jgi:protein-disulfide isomerase
MSKQFWGVIAVIVLVFVGIFALSGSGNSGSSGSPTNHIEGKGTTGVKLVEYGDFQCPYCGYYYAPLKEALAQYGDQIQFQFRNFPLTSAHPNAFAGARAAEAAALQGKYWQMHDKLYEENVPYYIAEQKGQVYNTWINSNDPETYFVQYAQALGLDVNKFKTDYASNKVNDLINADMKAGSQLNITGTPAFFLDGKLVSVTYNAAAIEKIINAEIVKKTGHSPAPATSATVSPAPTATPVQTTED